MSFRTWKPSNFPEAHFFKDSFIKKCPAVFPHNFCDNPGQGIAAAWIIMKHFSNIFQNLFFSQPGGLPVFLKSWKPDIVAAKRSRFREAARSLHFFQSRIVLFRKILPDIIKKRSFQLQLSLIQGKTHTNRRSRLGKRMHHLGILQGKRLPGSFKNRFSFIFYRNAVKLRFLFQYLQHLS